LSSSSIIACTAAIVLVSALRERSKKYLTEKSAGYLASGTKIGDERYDTGREA
jgi:hypothetical protein